MKKILFISISIIVLLILLTACKSNNPLYEYDKDGVMELFAATKLPCEVVDIQVTDRQDDSTTIFIELNISENILLENEYFQDVDDELALGYKADLLDYGVSEAMIEKFGTNFKEFIVHKGNETEYRPYQIYWFQLTERLQNESNLLLYTIIPYEISLKLEE